MPKMPDIKEVMLNSDKVTKQLCVMESSTPGRMVVGIADNIALHSVLKAGQNDVGIQRETQTLLKLSACQDVRLPRVLEHGSFGPWNVLVMSAFDCAERQASIWDVSRATAALVSGQLGKPVVHRDLAAWNMSVSQGKAMIWDWEKAEFTVRPLHDLIHFVVSSGEALRRWSPRTGLEILLEPRGPGADHLRRLGIRVNDARHFVSKYFDYVRQRRPLSPYEHRMDSMNA